MARFKSKDEELGRLCDSIRKDRLQLQYARTQRMEMARQTIGSHYSEDAADQSIPINIMSLYQSVVGRKLVSNDPQVMLSTFEAHDKPAVSIMEQWLNEEIEREYVCEELRRAVIDALSFVGIIKVGIANPAESALGGYETHAGQPYLKHIDFDDWCYDVHSRDFRSPSYMCHRSRVPVDALVKWLGKNKGIEGTEDKQFNAEGDERISLIGRGYYSDKEPEDFIDIWEIYRPRFKDIITVLDDSLSGAVNRDGIGPDQLYGKGMRRALRQQKWLGPECGPYHILSLGLAVGNALPRGPLHDIYDLHLGINNMARKLLRQAKDTKKITFFSGGSDKDSERINETPDGGSVRVDDPKGVVQMIMNAPVQELIQLMEQFIQRASWMGGNLELVGGLAPQAKTLGQDKLNESSSSSTINSMQSDTIKFTSEVLRSFCWFHHYHPFNVHKVSYTPPGISAEEGVSLTRHSYPNNPDVHQNAPNRIVRAHSFEDMHLRVDPYSLAHQTPEMRLSFIMGLVKQITPMMGMLQQQGMAFDVQAWLRKVGKYANDPDIDEIFHSMPPPPEESGSAPADPGQPMETERNYTRRSLGGDSQQAKEALLSNARSAGAASSNGQVKPVGAV